MRLVLDTNVVASGLLWVGAPPAKLIEAAQAGEVELFTSKTLLAELARILARKKFARETRSTDCWRRQLGWFGCRERELDQNRSVVRAIRDKLSTEIFRLGSRTLLLATDIESTHHAQAEARYSKYTFYNWLRLNAGPERFVL